MQHMHDKGIISKSGLFGDLMHVGLEEVFYYRPWGLQVLSGGGFALLRGGAGD